MYPYHDDSFVQITFPCQGDTCKCRIHGIRILSLAGNIHEGQETICGTLGRCTLFSENRIGQKVEKLLQFDGLIFTNVPACPTRRNTQWSEIHLQESSWAVYLREQRAIEETPISNLKEISGCVNSRIADSFGPTYFLFWVLVLNGI